VTYARFRLWLWDAFGIKPQRTGPIMRRGLLEWLSVKFLGKQMPWTAWRIPVPWSYVIGMGRLRIVSGDIYLKLYARRYGHGNFGIAWIGLNVTWMDGGYAYRNNQFFIERIYGGAALQPGASIPRPGSKRGRAPIKSAGARSR
jgi:hypothetical protein